MSGITANPNCKLNITWLKIKQRSCFRFTVYQDDDKGGDDGNKPGDQSP